ncbi:acyltransferase 3 [Citreicella sp. SE45]|nr:acyltransferase 3 [Citreicella sp. SE45]
MTETSKYRHDIDGLRAVAVTAVVIFHLVHALFPRGFLGVDVFFVISGYLITSIIWREAREKRFSFLVFYERRIRRLMPALLVVLIVTSVASIMILLPADLIGYGKSVLSALFFVANVYFWRDTNYFARSAEEKPLLNLWSLSVEEQFYIFFPFLLLVLVRFRRSALPVLWLTSIGSLAVNCMLLDMGGAAPAFYLLPSRAWELGAGALVALHGTVALRAPAGSVMRGLAVVLIVGGLFYEGPWPAVVPVALPVVVGTALLIWVGAPRASWTGWFLALRPVNAIGQISYSLYLWHWPIIVLYKYYVVRDLTMPEAALIGVASVVVAALSWRYVEQPFRRRDVSFRRLLAWTAAGALPVSAAAVVILVGNGLPGRLSSEAAAINESVGTHYRCPVSQMQAFGASRACDLTLHGQSVQNAQVALLGNSHAQMYAPIVRAGLDDLDAPAVLIPLNGCLPSVSVNISGKCRAAAESNLEEMLALPDLQTVIVAFNWPTNVPLYHADGSEVEGPHSAALLEGIEDLIDRLAGLNIVVVGPMARPGYDIASVLSRQIAFDRAQHVPRWTEAGPFYAEFGPVLDTLSRDTRITFVRPDLVQCRDGTCDFVRDGISLFSDSGHIAEPALGVLAPAFEPVFANLAAQRAGG